VVIDDLYLVGAAIAPFKTDAPLVVNTDRILAIAATRQFLEADLPVEPSSHPEKRQRRS
jgi:hypothetical protein